MRLYGALALVSSLCSCSSHSNGNARGDAGSASGPDATSIDATSIDASGIDASGMVTGIPSNFDINSELVPSWGTGDIPPSAAPDVVGAFRFGCSAGQVLADDPIVYPGQPGMSHLHQFFGNTGANAASDYTSLRTTGESTCMSKLNRSAYWQPAMVDGSSNVVKPSWAIYYKRYPVTSPLCQQQGDECVAVPYGLRFIFGYDLVTNTPATGSLFWQCVSNDGNTVTNPTSATMTAALNGCPIGAQLEARIEAPDCWDGVRLDSPNHRAHVAFATYDNGVLRCPTGFPKVIPQFTLAAFWTVTSNVGTWRLSSDKAAQPPGATFHSDFFSAWDPGIEKVWTENCIDKLLNCSGGDLGNGTQLRDDMTSVP